MAGYTKEFLLSVLEQKYSGTFISIEAKDKYMHMASIQYDFEGKDKFRVSASLDADAIKKFRLETK